MKIAQPCIPGSSLSFANGQIIVRLHRSQRWFTSYERPDRIQITNKHVTVSLNRDEFDKYFRFIAK